MELGQNIGRQQTNAFALLMSAAAEVVQEFEPLTIELDNVQQSGLNHELLLH